MRWSCYAIGDISLDIHDSIYDKQYKKYRSIDLIEDITAWCKINGEDLDLQISEISNISENKNGTFSFEIIDNLIKTYIYENYIFGKSIEYVAVKRMNSRGDGNKMYLKYKKDGEIGFTNNLEDAMTINYDLIYWVDLEKEFEGFDVYLRRRESI